MSLHTDLRSRIPNRVSTRELLFAAAFSLILIQLVFRAWAVYGSWFYGDDLKFLANAATQPLTLDYLFTRHQQQLMPGGLLVSWLVGQGPAYSWPLAATSILAMQAAASGLCLLMLVRLFGWRPGILVPLTLYLFSPMTLGAYMWWAAALNQLPLQIAFFGLLITHVSYVRTLRLRWAALSVLILVVGLLFYIKSVVIIPVLVLLTLLYFVDGRAVPRIRTTIRKFWPVWTGYLVVGAGYLGAYALSGSSPVGKSANAAYLATADAQIRQTLGPTLIGGPWRWLNQGRQDVLADAPEFAVTVAWVVISLVVIATCWRRVGAWRAWAILGAYLIPTVYLTASGRSTLFGPEVGAYVRYITDVSVVVCLALALATLTIVGQAETETRGLNPARSFRVLVPIGLLVFTVGSAWSSVTYVRPWHEDSPSEQFVSTARADLEALDGVDIIDEPVREDLVLGPNAPFDRPTKLLSPLKQNLRPVTRGVDLEMFGPRGRLTQAVVTPGITARLGDTPGCGVSVIGSKKKTIPLTSAVTDDTWWMSLNYLASHDGEVKITYGDTSRTVPTPAGPHTMFVRTTGSFDAVSIQSFSSSENLCVDHITVGFIGTFE